MSLLIGYGNPGRGDDGLGPEFAKWASAQALPGLDVIVDFQLKVEHAISVASASRVLFVDACTDSEEAFSLSQLTPSEAIHIDSHSLHPTAVLSLARLLFDATPPAHVLAITGTRFEMLHDELSMVAHRNLAEAKKGFLNWYAGTVSGHTAETSSRDLQARPEQ